MSLVQILLVLFVLVVVGAILKGAASLWNSAIIDDEVENRRLLDEQATRANKAKLRYPKPEDDAETIKSFLNRKP